VTTPVSVCVFKTREKVLLLTSDVLKVAPLSAHSMVQLKYKKLQFYFHYGSTQVECVAEESAEENIRISGRK